MNFGALDWVIYTLITYYAWINILLFYPQNCLICR